MCLVSSSVLGAPLTQHSVRMTTITDAFGEIYSSCDVLLTSLRHEKVDDSAPCETDMKQFQNDLVSHAKMLSHEATKFAVAHSSPPFPDPATTQTLGGSMCNMASQLIGCYLLLPLSTGSTFLKMLSSELEQLITNLKQFVEAIQKIVLNNHKLDSCLLSTGLVWEFCDKVPTLPMNNAEAVSSVLIKEEQLVADAIEELDEAVTSTAASDDSDEDDATIRGVAVTLLPSVKGLIKSAGALIRKTKKLVSHYYSPNLSKLDPLAERVSSLSHRVDDLVCSLYSPVKVQQVVEFGSVLSSSLRQLLDAVKGIAGEEDQQWIELLTTAIQHNLTNLQSKATSE